MTSRGQQLLNLWRTESVPFLTAYVLTGLLCILIPAIQHGRSVRAYKNSYYYQYEQQNQSQDNNNGRQEYDINNCKWWQWRCTPQYVNENGEYVNQNDEDDNGENNWNTPSWFSGWGNGNRSGDRSRDGGVANSASIKFVYAWQLLLFVGLFLAGGAWMIYKNRPTSGVSVQQSRMALQTLLVVLFLWTNTTFMALWMLANGSISVEGREIEEVGGFYNQFSVLMFLTNFWYTIWGLVFMAVLTFQLCRSRRAGTTDHDATARPGDSMNYLPYNEPSVTVTGVDNPNSGLFHMTTSSNKGGSSGLIF